MSRTGRRRVYYLRLRELSKVIPQACGEVWNFIRATKFAGAGTHRIANSSDLVAGACTPRFRWSMPCLCPAYGIGIPQSQLYKNWNKS